MDNPIKKIAVTQLVFDQTLYPRELISSVNVTRIANALATGIEIPPIVVEAKSLRIVDGVHRWKAWRKVNGDESEIPSILVKYSSEAEAFADAVRRNCGHGMSLNPFEMNKCRIRLEELGIESEKIAGVLLMPVEAVTKLTAAKTAFSMVGGKRVQVGIKGALTDFRGEILTQRQLAVNKYAGGLRPAYYVNLLIGLIRAGLVRKVNQQTLGLLGTLAEEITAALDSLRKSKIA